MVVAQGVGEATTKRVAHIAEELERRGKEPQVRAFIQRRDGAALCRQIFRLPYHLPAVVAVDEVALCQCHLHLEPVLAPRALRG